MTASQLVFFGCWLALAIAAGVLIVLAWERLRIGSKGSAEPATARPPDRREGQAPR
jgi:hypothetical protein